MKKYLLFLLIFASCQKADFKPAPDFSGAQKPLELMVDTLTSSQRESMRAEYLAERGKPPRPPKPIKNFPVDTVVITPQQGATIALLDWNGHTSTGNAWAINYGTNGVLYSPAANVTEAQVDYIIDKASTEFAPWKITFTKDEALFNAHTGKKTRIVLTSVDVLFPGATGVGFVGSNEGQLSEVFVFTENMFNLDRYMFRIVVHEMGHAASLYHQSLYNADCSLNSRYRYGYKMGYDWDSETGGIFGYGTSLSCNIYQDDNLVLNNTLGRR